MLITYKKDSLGPLVIIIVTSKSKVMLKIERVYSSPYRRVSVETKSNNNHLGSNESHVAEATTSNMEAGARKHRNTFDEVMKNLYMTPGYIQEMGRIVTSSIVSTGEIACPNIEDIKAFRARVDLIFKGYIEMILRTHFEEAAYGCFKWERKEVSSLLNGYKSQALREAEEAELLGKKAEKRAFYKIANFCDSKLNAHCITVMLNNIIEDVFSMEDLCLEGFQTILASKYAKNFNSFRETEKKKMELRAEMVKAKRIK